MPPINKKILALDTECGGLDLAHGVLPFFVTTCDDKGNQFYWEWDVNPVTRKPVIPDGDLEDIRKLVASAKVMAGMNCRFDAKALRKVGIEWPWDITQDCLIAGHLLNSSEPHDLGSMSVTYLGKDISKYEDDLEKAVRKARSIARSKLKHWRIAKQGDPTMPSIRGSKKEEKAKGVEQGSTWRADYWLPRAVAREMGYTRGECRVVHCKKDAFDVYIGRPSKWGNPFVIGKDGSREQVIEKYRKWILTRKELLNSIEELDGKVLGCYCDPQPCHGHVLQELLKDRGHPWYKVLADYANMDSITTLELWLAQEAELKRLDLWAIYRERMKLLPILQGMEERGVGYSESRTKELKKRLQSESNRSRNLCLSLARSACPEIKLESLPVNGRSKALNDVVFNGFKLLSTKKTKKGNVSMDKHVLDEWLLTLNHSSKGYHFIKQMLDYRKCQTGLGYIASYEKFAVNGRVHCSLNPTGTSTLRMSSSNPNCVDGDTEFLTTLGWVKASELTESHVVAQYWKETKAINFVSPTRLVREKFVGNMYRIKTEQQIDLLVTPNHRCLIQHRHTDKFKDCLPQDFNEDYKHFSAGVYIGGQKYLSKFEVMWLCAVQADGSYQGRNLGKFYGIKFAFKKDRKIKRLRECLDGLGIQYKESVSMGVTCFNVHKDDPFALWAKEKMPDKCFGEWILENDRATLDLFVQELFEWDGDYTRKQAWGSSDKKSADWVQIIYALSGKRAFLSMRNIENEKTRNHHVVNISSKDYSMTTNFTREEVPWNDKVYCVTVPSSYVVIRRNGRVSITGNSQQMSEEERYCFGPEEGREWYSIDYENLELRLTAYDSNERVMIELFEKPNDPPYFGSYHLLNASIVYPDLFWPIADIEGEFKKRYKNSWYKFIKGFGFALSYGAMLESGTADRAARKVGAQAMVMNNLKEHTKLNQSCISFAKKHGYIETIPDKTVDPNKGYPVFFRRTFRGDIKPTLPLNYRIQSTGVQCASKAMVRCEAQLQEWTRQDPRGYYIVMYIHDELVFDFPAGDPDNKRKIGIIKKLMEQSGDDIGIPLKVSVTLNRNNWSEGESVHFDSVA